MTRAPVTLTRETKLLLSALGLLAVLGGWTVWNSSHQTQQITSSVTPPAQTATKPGQVTTTPQGKPGQTVPATTTPGDNTTGTGNTGTVNVAPKTAAGKTDVVTAPPFPATAPDGSTADPTVVVAPPTGINPNQPLNGLNGRNPFKPLKVNTENQPQSTAPVNTSASTAPAPVTISRPSSSASQIDSALASTPDSSAGGALPIPRIPTTTATVPNLKSTSTPDRASSNPDTVSGSSVNSGGALPIPTITGATEAATAQNQGQTKGQTQAQPAAPAASHDGSGQAPTTVKVPPIERGAAVTVPNTATNGAQALPSMPSAPATPPVTSLNVPSVSPNTGTDATAPGKSNAAQNGVVATVPSSTNPQVMTKLGQSSPADTSTSSAPNDTIAIDRAITEHQLVFNTAVLGKVKTAIFHSNEGYVIVTVGQPIPNTTLILKDLTATTATLASGTTTKTLQLDQR
ncbi:hypothetical protein [Deinococcus sp.]|uniref:hypothetical protein n=1 Tax=Deinococcus sp. TaxID=47478 RepID=UPI0025BA7F8E|nr:hypothetical protein [Deinococcus sp.]